MTIILRRLSASDRLSDITRQFGHQWSPARVSTLFHALCRYLKRRWRHRLAWLPDMFTVDACQRAATSIHNKGCPIPNVVGFIDCTRVKVQRPPDDKQNAFYSGYKRTHVIIFQGKLYKSVRSQREAITCPAGFMCLHGPYLGCMNDLGILSRSQLINFLETNLPSGRMLLGDLGEFSVFFLHSFDVYRLQRSWAYCHGRLCRENFP